jgi:hypothetical protein
MNYRALVPLLLAPILLTAVATASPPHELRKAGEYRYACAMDMVAGVLKVE